MRTYNSSWLTFTLFSELDCLLNSHFYFTTENGTQRSLLSWQDSPILFLSGENDAFFIVSQTFGQRIIPDGWNGGARTHDPLINSQMLLPAELRSKINKTLSNEFVIIADTNSHAIYKSTALCF